MPTGEGFKVFVVDEKGIAQSRPVKIGGRTDHAAWITDGLKAGENIVTQGAYGVDDSAKVETGGRPKTEDRRPRTRTRERQEGARDRGQEAVSEPRGRWALFDVIASQRRFIYLAIALLSAAGMWSRVSAAVGDLPRAELPADHGRGAGLVALGARSRCFAVTRPIEEAVSLVPGVTRVRSRSIRGGERDPDHVRAEGTDMPYALQLVQTRVEQIRGDLPPGLDIEIERMTPTLFPIVSVQPRGRRSGDAVRHRALPDQADHLARARAWGAWTCRAATSARSRSSPIRRGSRRAGMTYDDLAAAIRQGDRRRRRRAAWPRTTSST